MLSGQRSITNNIINRATEHLLLSTKKITVPPTSAIIPSTPEIVATRIPAKAKPKVTPMLLRGALIAVWLALRVAVITFLVDTEGQTS